MTFTIKYLKRLVFQFCRASSPQNCQGGLRRGSVLNLPGRFIGLDGRIKRKYK